MISIINLQKVILQCKFNLDNMLDNDNFKDGITVQKIENNMKDSLLITAWNVCPTDSTWTQPPENKTTL